MAVTMTSIYPIRDAKPADAAALSRLKLATFREAFLEDHAIPYPADDIVVFEAETYGLDRVTAELADPAHRTWVVDGANGELIAYAHVGPCKLPHEDVRPGDWEIYQLYLRREVQGGGLGSALLAHVLDWLADQNGPIWLGVWSGNHGAQALYKRWGFTVVGEHRFRVGSWLDEELTMRLDAIPMSGGR
jgi:ribosomal protein S18 acetylase RimI-like enzyme